MGLSIDSRADGPAAATAAADENRLRSGVTPAIAGALAASAVLLGGVALHEVFEGPRGLALIDAAPGVIGANALTALAIAFAETERRPPVEVAGWLLAAVAPILAAFAAASALSVLRRGELLSPGAFADALLQPPQAGVLVLIASPGRALAWSSVARALERGEPTFGSLQRHVTLFAIVSPIVAPVLYLFGDCLIFAAARAAWRRRGRQSPGGAT